MPLLTAGPLGVPTTHEGCQKAPLAGRCVLCQAESALTPADWSVVGFFRRVRNQVVNVFPMAVTKKGEAPPLRPSLADWEAACRIYRVPEQWRGHLVDLCLWLYQQVTDPDGEEVAEVADMKPWQLEPPKEVLCGAR